MRIAHAKFEALNSSSTWASPACGLLLGSACELLLANPPPLGRGRRGDGGHGEVMGCVSWCVLRDWWDWAHVLFKGHNPRVVVCVSGRTRSAKRVGISSGVPKWAVLSVLQEFWTWARFGTHFFYRVRAGKLVPSFGGKGPRVEGVGGR